MIKVKPISLKDWFLITPGVFLMGFAIGLALGGFTFAPWIFVLGFFIEMPALIAIKRHKWTKI